MNLHSVVITLAMNEIAQGIFDGVKVSCISRKDALLQPVIIKDRFRLTSIADITKLLTSL